jgi:hypothetical protein
MVKRIKDIGYANNPKSKGGIRKFKRRRDRALDPTKRVNPGTEINVPGDITQPQTIPIPVTVNHQPLSSAALELNVNNAVASHINYLNYQNQPSTSANVHIYAADNQIGIPSSSTTVFFHEQIPDLFHLTQEGNTIIIFISFNKKVFSKAIFDRFCFYSHI